MPASVLRTQHQKSHRERKIPTVAPPIRSWLTGRAVRDLTARIPARYVRGQLFEQLPATRQVPELNHGSSTPLSEKIVIFQLLSQCVTSLIPDIEKVLSEAATIEEEYYQLLCGNVYQISKKELEESRKIKRK